MLKIFYIEYHRIGDDKNPMLILIVSFKLSEKTYTTCESEAYNNTYVEFE